ncbi:MAG: hypothetical protein WCI48_02675 [Bacteroidota bacterium]|jgi:hypothetical protein
MAFSKTNMLTNTYRGKVGDQFVLKNYSGKSVMSKIPVFTKPWSEKQNEHRLRFSQACKKAKALASRPEIRELYTEKLRPDQSVYNLVLREVMNGVFA